MPVNLYLPDGSNQVGIIFNCMHLLFHALCLVDAYVHVRVRKF